MAANQFDWNGFRALTKRLADLVAAERDDAEFAEELRRALTFVYTAGVTMPPAGDIFEDAGGESFWDGTSALGSSQAADSGSIAAAELFAELIANSAEAAQPDSLGDPDEITDVATTAAENILDVVRALAVGDEFFDAKRMHEAQWEWSFGFDDWGAHALAGLTALHELLWGAR